MITASVLNSEIGNVFHFISSKIIYLFDIGIKYPYLTVVFTFLYIIISGLILLNLVKDTVKNYNIINVVCLTSTFLVVYTMLVILINVLGV